MSLWSLQEAKKYTDKEVKTVDDRITTLTIEQQQDGEVIEARKGEVSLKAKMDSIDAQLADSATQINSMNAKTKHIINVSDFGVVNTSAVVDQTMGIQQAIDYAASIGGGTVQFNNATYYACGITPRNNVTLQGTGRSTLKLIPNAVNHLIYYYDDALLNNFNLVSMTFDGNNQSEYDAVHISQPNPLQTGNYTWSDAVIDRCFFINAKIGLFCAIPGSVKISNTVIKFNDIGISQVAEHFYLNNVRIGNNRIGAYVPRMNDVTWTQVIFGHNTEYGIKGNSEVGAGVMAQVALVGCSFIDSPVAIEGLGQYVRLIGCRFMMCDYGIKKIFSSWVITGCEFTQIVNTAIVVDSPNDGASTIISNNIFTLNGADIFVGYGHEQTMISNNQFSRTINTSIETGAGTVVGFNCQGNTFYNISTEGQNLNPCIKINGNIMISVISNNIFRNSATGKASHAILFGETVTADDVIVTGNIARAMRTAGYQLDTAVLQTNNKGTVVTV